MGHLKIVAGLLERLKALCGKHAVKVTCANGRYAIVTRDADGRHRLLVEINFFSGEEQ